MSQPERSKKVSDRTEFPSDLADGIMRLADRLRFPVNSKSELTKQLGGPDAAFSLRGMREVSAKTWVQLVPAQLFPIVTKDNFVEKVTELYTPPQSLHASVEELTAAVTRLMQENSSVLEQVLNAVRRQIGGS